MQAIPQNSSLTNSAEQAVSPLLDLLRRFFCARRFRPRALFLVPSVGHDTGRPKLPRGNRGISRGLEVLAGSVLLRAQPQEALTVTGLRFHRPLVWGTMLRRHPEPNRDSAPRMQASREIADTNGENEVHGTPCSYGTPSPTVKWRKTQSYAVEQVRLLPWGLMLGGVWCRAR